MRNTSLLWLLGLALPSSSLAMQNVRAMKVPGPVRYAGVYRVATGTWDYSGNCDNMSTTKVYSADTPSGYFGVGWETYEGVDEGILPGTSNAEFGGTGSADEYLIDGFSFGYCTQEPGRVGFEVILYDSYVACDNPDAPANCLDEAGAVDLSGLPGGAVNACWVVTIDLGRGKICMDADGGPCAPGAQGAASGLDHFGWGLDMDPATYTGVFTGPLLEGYDPQWANPGEGTCYNAGLGCAASGLHAGAGAGDLFAIGAPLSGCFFFGGYANPKGCGGPHNTPPGQMSFNLFAGCTVPCTPGTCFTTYCNPGDGNPGNVASLSACSCSVSSLLTVDATNVPPGQNGYLIVGDGTGVIVNPSPTNSGSLCVVGGTCIGRYVLDVQNSGSSGTYSTDVSDSNTAGPGFALPAACTGSIDPGETWNFQYWHRLPGGSDTFSEAISIPFSN